MRRTAHPLMAVAITFLAAGVASAFGICKKCVVVPVVPAVGVVGYHAAPAMVPLASYGYAAAPAAYAPPAAAYGAYAAYPPPAAAPGYYGGGYAAAPGYGYGGGAQAAPPATAPVTTTPHTTAVGGLNLSGLFSDILAPALIKMFLDKFMSCSSGMGPGSSPMLSEAALRDLIDSRLDAKVSPKLRELNDKLDKIINSLKPKDMSSATNRFESTKTSPTTVRNRSEISRTLATMNTRQVGWSSREAVPVKANSKTETTHWTASRPAPRASVSAKPNPQSGSKAAEVKRLLAEVDAKQAGWKRPVPVSVAANPK